MIEMGFLMVGRTHEDIDVLFSRFSEQLRTSHTVTLPHLMRTFNECTNCRPAPFLMTEVFDFKGFIDGYLCDGQDKLIGHSKPLHFRFFMQDDIPVMQYKMNHTQDHWMPKGGAIELWKRDASGKKALLPVGEPMLLPMGAYIKDSGQMVSGIKDYIKYWDKLRVDRGLEDSYYTYIKPVIEYWEDMIKALSEPNIQSQSIMSQSFWPQMNHEIEQDSNTNKEDFMGLKALEDHFCGPQNKRPKDAFQPLVDVTNGDFVLIRPSENIYPIWLGVAESDIETNHDSEHYNMILIQYWAPCSRKKNASDKEVYANCWEKFWMCNDKDPIRWEHRDSIVWSWTPKGAQGKKGKKIKIPPTVCEKAQASLVVGDEATVQQE